MSYFFIIREFPGESFNIIFLDGVFRFILPVLIIVLDLKFKSFTRRFQFLMSLSLMGMLFTAVLVLMAVFRFAHDTYAVMILVIVGGMINECVFWMNIVQVTTQRYPTVIRCTAFGCLHSVKHIGTIVGLLVMQPLLRSSFPIGIFILPTAFIGLTLLVGVFLQPDTKGKALLDTIDELDYTRVESALPKALFKMAAMHRVMQSELHNKLAEENRDKWAEWRQELEKRESGPGVSSSGGNHRGQDDSGWQRGHVNEAAQVSSDDEGANNERDGNGPWNYKSIAFLPHHQQLQQQQRDQLNSELKLRIK